MACVTFNSLMFAIQLEVYRVMVKTGGSPGCGGMAGRAIRLELPSMGVFCRVAGFTILRQPLQLSNCLHSVVAVLARNLLVHTGEDKGCFGVVKIREAVYAIMAGKAVAGKGLLMGLHKSALVLTMAVDAQTFFGPGESMWVTIGAGKSRTAGGF